MDQKRRYARNRAARLSEEKKCKCCGASYQRKDGFVKYCSESCRKRAGSSNGNARRRAHIAAAPSWPVSFSDVFDRDAGACSLCDSDTPIELRGSHDDAAPELDHIIPLSRGGHHAPYNIQLSCRKCNLAKGNRIYARDRVRAKAMWPEKLVIRRGEGRPTARNTSGKRGVFFDKLTNRWIAQMDREGRRQREGYKTKDEALAARRRMEHSDASKKESSIVARYFASR